MTRTNLLEMAHGNFVCTDKMTEEEVKQKYWQMLDKFWCMMLDLDGCKNDLSERGFDGIEMELLEKIRDRMAMIFDEPNFFKK